MKRASAPAPIVRWIVSTTIVVGLVVWVFERGEPLGMCFVVFLMLEPLFPRWNGRSGDGLVKDRALESVAAVFAVVVSIGIAVAPVSLWPIILIGTIVRAAAWNRRVTLLLDGARTRVLAFFGARHTVP